MAIPRAPAQIDSGLLARKGEARPAMRPHGIGEAPVGIGDDLGWNDLGEPKPAVLRERARLATVPAAPLTEPLVLNLDADRLLRLRLAAAVRNISPEAFVLDVLDRSLPSTSDIAALVQRVGPDAGAKGKP